MSDPRREILTQVAAGTITAEEGAARLEALESPADAPAPAAAPVAAAPTRQVRVVTRFGNTEVVGDPTVDIAVADGPHNARQVGDTLLIEQTALTDDSAFEFNRPYARIRIPGFDFNRKLTVRVNPALALVTSVQAGNLHIEGINGPVTSDVQAGNCTVERFAGPIKLSVAAGNIDASGRLDGGESSIRCRMGEVNVTLDRSSSVRITARTNLGEVDLRAIKDQKIGSGAGTLDVSCTMGNVRVGLA